MYFEPWAPGLGLPSSPLGHYGGHRGADTGELDVARVFTSKFLSIFVVGWELFIVSLLPTTKGQTREQSWQ